MLNMASRIFGGAISIAHYYENRIPSATKVAPPHYDFLKLYDD